MNNEKSACIVAIDPGLKGGVAGVGKHGSSWVKRMPVTKPKGKKPRIDAEELSHLLCSLDPDLFVIEKMGIFPGTSRVALFSLGYQEGLIQGIMEAMAYDYLYVRPHSWKKILPKENRPDMKLIREARQRFPQHQDDLKNARKDSGIAAALLIAAWWIETEGWGSIGA